MTERRRDEQRVRSALQNLEAPDEPSAAERARRVVEAAFAEHEPTPPRSPVPRRAGLAILAAAAAVGFALTPAGAEVRGWIADTIEPGEEDAEPRLSSLPTPGSVLVETPTGAWTINEEGAKRRLGRFELATWSPNGRFIGVSRGRELRAIDPTGGFRWSIEAPDRIDALDWSSDEGYRVAYLARGQVRVVAGDGAQDRLLLEPARPVKPVWRPEADPADARHELTYVDTENRVVLINADTETVIWRSERFLSPLTELEWSVNGDVLMAEAGEFKTLLGEDGQPLYKGPLSTAKVGEATLSPSGDAVVLERRSKTGHELLMLAPATGRERILYRTKSGARDRGDEFDAPVFSPDGEWVLLPWQAADQWLFIRVEDRRVIAVADIARQFEAAAGPDSFPRVAGWCC